VNVKNVTDMVLFVFATEYLQATRTVQFFVWFMVFMAIKPEGEGYPGQREWVWVEKVVKFLCKV
jgi:hypothetical protein